MGVRVWYTMSSIGNYCRGLIGPDYNGVMQIPPLKQNLFVRDGTCGSAPLYHQEAWSQLRFSCSEKITCFYDLESECRPYRHYSHSAEICRGTWLKSVMWRYRDPYTYRFLYSANGKKYTYSAYCDYRDMDEFDEIIHNPDISTSSKVDMCWQLRHTQPEVKEGWEGYTNSVYTEATPVKGSLSRRYYDFWELATETGLVMPDHDLRIALSKASEDLAANLPQTPINIAESLLDLVSVKSISRAFGTTEKVSAMLADSWLKWRYVYTTTKLDVKSVREFINRGLSLFDGMTSRDFTCYGYAHYGDLVCRCSTTLQCKDVKEQFRRASQSLHTYDLWDIVPWSFIVDWFIPIGSMLQNLEYQSNLLRLDHGPIWYTCKWYEDSDSDNFFRFCTDSFVTSPCSIIYDKGATNKTIAMRCIDAMALLIGR